MPISPNANLKNEKINSATPFIARKSLGVFALVMINVIAVDNLRSLSIGAQYGFALVFFYLLAALLFFIPTVLVSAELATGWPTTGGVYIWVREAFGSRIGFLTIWLQWIYNVVWFPTIFAFIAGILAKLIEPSLVENKIYMLIVILITFWGATFLNCLGIRVSSLISTLGAILGTILPMLFIAFLGFLWVYVGHQSQTPFTTKAFLPTLSSMKNLAFLTNVLFGLMGMEMSAVHAGDVKNPTKNYPRALIYSTIIILTTLISSCLAIAIVIPNKELNLISGLMDAFYIFFNTFHLTALTPVIVLLIILGSLSGATAWIIGPARGLFVASEDTNLPPFFKKLNKKEMPVGILIAQGILVTLLCTIFFIMPSVNSSYWVLSNLTAQLGLLFYLFIFAAAIRLRYKHPQVKRFFKIPGGFIGTWLVCGIGMLTCLFAIVIGFLPPAQVALESIPTYEMILIIGMALCCLPPFVLYAKNKKKGSC